jgi:hypothetical protein
MPQEKLEFPSSGKLCPDNSISSFISLLSAKQAQQLLGGDLAAHVGPL